VRGTLALFAGFCKYLGVLWCAFWPDEYASFEVAGVTVAAVSAFTHG
jgi:hypothetical protein